MTWYKISTGNATLSFGLPWNVPLVTLTNNGMWLVLSVLLSQWSKCCGLILTKVMTRFAVDKSSDKVTPRSIFFYQSINVKENVFFRARAEKGIGWHTDESSTVWTLIENGKVANRIARLVACVVHVKCIFLVYTLTSRFVSLRAGSP